MTTSNDDFATIRRDHTNRNTSSQSNNLTIGTNFNNITYAVLGGISKGLKKDKSVQLIGFGTFLVKKRKARNARNPQTGAMIKVKASRTVGFKVGKKFKEMI